MSVGCNNDIGLEEVGDAMVAVVLGVENVLCVHKLYKTAAPLRK